MPFICKNSLFNGSSGIWGSRMLNYERGLEKLQEIVQRQKSEYLAEFGVFQSRLLECLERERRYGQSSNNDADRNEVLDRLMHFASEHFAIHFIELCRSSGIMDEPLPERNAPAAPTYEEIWKGGRSHIGSSLPTKSSYWMDVKLCYRILALPPGNTSPTRDQSSIGHPNRQLQIKGLFSLALTLMCIS
jgi:hypothetical protein